MRVSNYASDRTTSVTGHYGGTSQRTQQDITEYLISENMFENITDTCIVVRTSSLCSIIEDHQGIPQRNINCLSNKI